MTKYKEIAETIKKRIVNMEYPTDVPLPNQETLATEFNTSRVTIQKALQLLMIEGVLFTRQGSGTYVRQNTLQKPHDLVFNEYLGITGTIFESGVVTNKIITFTVRFPNEEEADKLLIDKTAPIYDIVRLRLLDGEPYLMEYTIIPVNVIANINEEILLKSIYTYIINDLKLTIVGANRRITADSPNSLEKVHLNCSENDPMLQVEQVAYLSNGIPFEYTKSRHRYDKRGIMVLNLYN